MPIKPLKDFLLLKDTDHEGQTEGGIYVPQSVGNEAKVKRGIVVALGEDLEPWNDDEPVYEVGDTVLYSIFGGNEVRDGNQKFWLVADKEVWGKIVEKE